MYFFVVQETDSAFQLISTIHSQCICYYLLSPDFAVVKYMESSSAKKALDKIVLIKGEKHFISIQTEFSW